MSLLIKRSADISNQRFTECIFFHSFSKSSPRAKMKTILLPCFQHRLLCIYPLNYWAKKMVPAMVAWPERCQAEVPSQPFFELFVISRAQSDSQRQMVFKQNGCGRKSGSWLNQPWQCQGTAKAGLRRRSKWEPVVPQLSAILFQRDSLRAAKNNCAHRSEVTCCRKKPDSNLTRSFVWSSQRCVTQTWISYSFETVFRLRPLADSPRVPGNIITFLCSLYRLQLWPSFCFRDGPQETARKLGIFTDGERNDPPSSTSNQVLIRFRSNTEKGGLFRIDYQGM